MRDVVTRAKRVGDGMAGGRIDGSEAETAIE
jgi:hypothetical protein